MMEYSGAFFDTLGQYVYQYIDDEGNVYYTGKGNGSRCIAHVKDKGFDHKDCWIVAKNLERFEDKKDWQSFLLESYLIQRDQPNTNSVSGHYKDCFIMAKLSDYFDSFVSEQYDNFANLPDWYAENYDVFRGKLREVKLNAKTTFILSNAQNAIYLMSYVPVNVTDEGFTVVFEINQDGDKLSESKTKLKQWLKDSGYSPESEGKTQKKWSITVSDISELVKLFDDFAG
jgi:hypothetical protein